MQTPSSRTCPHASGPRPSSCRSCCTLHVFGRLWCGLKLSDCEVASRSRFCREQRPCWFSWPRFPSGIPLWQCVHPTMRWAIWNTTGIRVCPPHRTLGRSGTSPVVFQHCCWRCNQSSAFVEPVADPPGCRPFPFPLPRPLPLPFRIVSAVERTPKKADFRVIWSLNGPFWPSLLRTNGGNSSGFVVNLSSCDLISVENLAQAWMPAANCSHCEK